MNPNYQPAGPPPPEAPRPLTPEDRYALAVDQLRVGARQLYDFVAYGNPELLPELECFLIESGSDLHVEELLDDLADAFNLLAARQEGAAA